MKERYSNIISLMLSPSFYVAPRLPTSSSFWSLASTLFFPAYVVAKFGNSSSIANESSSWVKDCSLPMEKRFSHSFLTKLSSRLSVVPRNSAPFLFSSSIDVVPAVSYVEFLGSTSVCCPPDVDNSPASWDDCSILRVGYSNLSKQLLTWVMTYAHVGQVIYEWGALWILHQLVINTSSGVSPTSMLKYSWINSLKALTTMLTNSSSRSNRGKVWYVSQKGISPCKPLLIPPKNVKHSNSLCLRVPWILHLSFKENYSSGLLNLLFKSAYS